MYKDWEIFIFDFNELEKLLSNPSEENILAAARLMRKFFVDRHSLASVISKLVKSPLRFTVKICPKPSAEIEVLLRQATFQIDNSFSPDLPANCPLQEVDLEKFLRLTAVPLGQGPDATFRDVIKYIADCIAVHYGSKRDDKQIALEAAINSAEPIMTQLGIVPRQQILQTFFLISRIALKALVPLRNAVREVYGE